MVSAGEPQGGVALHALKARQDVLQRRVHCMAHVQLAGDVRRRHDDGKRLFVRVGLGLEAVVVHPHLIDAALDLLGLIDLG